MWEKVGVGFWYFVVSRYSCPPEQHFDSAGGIGSSPLRAVWVDGKCRWHPCVIDAEGSCQPDLFSYCQG